MFGSVPSPQPIQIPLEAYEVDAQASHAVLPLLGSLPTPHKEHFHPYSEYCPAPQLAQLSSSAVGAAPGWHDVQLVRSPSSPTGMTTFGCAHAWHILSPAAAKKPASHATQAVWPLSGTVPAEHSRFLQPAGSGAGSGSSFRCKMRLSEPSAGFDTRCGRSSRCWRAATAPPVAVAADHNCC